MIPWDCLQLGLAKNEALCKKMKLPEDCANGGGYFWISRGNNTCGIEENVCAATANVENINYSTKDTGKDPIMSENPYWRF